METVLVLNADYSPLTICSAERAFLLIFLQKAELITQQEDRLLRSVDQQYPFPSVIKIKKYVNVPYKGVILTRHNIFKRDRYACQYCGDERELTLDHLIPKSKGGKSTWTNLVTACKTCNAKKGDFSPEEVGMKLVKTPFRPSYLMFLKSSSSIRPDWMPYLEQKASA